MVPRRRIIAEALKEAYQTSKHFPDIMSQQSDQQHTANATNPE